MSSSESAAEPSTATARPASTVSDLGTTVGPRPHPARAPLARRLWPVLVAVVAAIVVVGIVAFTLEGSGSSGNRSAPPYSSATRTANSVATGVSGGPWNLVVAFGVNLAVSITALANATVGSGCTYSAPGGGAPPSTLFVPRYGGSFSSGGSPWWGMVYFQPISHDVLLVDVINGSAQSVLVASGSCTNTFENYTTIPAKVVDSPTVASAVWGPNGGGAAFLAAHSNRSFNMFMGVLGGGSACLITAGPCWLVEYTPCNPFGQSNPAGNQPSLGWLLNGATGTILTGLTGSSTCSSGGFVLAHGADGGSEPARPLLGP